VLELRLSLEASEMARSAAEANQREAAGLVAALRAKLGEWGAALDETRAESEQRAVALRVAEVIRVGENWGRDN
jgi:hypothetical protein